MPKWSSSRSRTTPSRRCARTWPRSRRSPEDRPALTGPAARADTGTIARHLEALAARAPETVEAYVALARVATRLAVEAGSLPSEGGLRVDEVLARWR